RRDDQQHDMHGLSPLRPGIHAVSRAGCASGRSNIQKSRTRTAARNGTSASESAEAGPNCPDLMASQYACVPATGNTMRPAVSIQTLARSEKAVVSDRNTARARNGLRSGTVTSQKRRQALFDSSSAQSKSSGGTALMPARRKTPRNELPRQMLKRITLRKAQAPPPKAESTEYFRVPMNTLYAVGIGGLSVQYQPTMLTLAGYAHGRKTARNTSARPRNGRARSNAKPIPR